MIDIDTMVYPKKGPKTYFYQQDTIGGIVLFGDYRFIIGSWTGLFLVCLNFHCSLEDG